MFQSKCVFIFQHRQKYQKHEESIICCLFYQENKYPSSQPSYSQAYLASQFARLSLKLMTVRRMDILYVLCFLFWWNLLFQGTFYQVKRGFPLYKHLHLTKIGLLVVHSSVQVFSKFHKLFNFIKAFLALTRIYQSETIYVVGDFEAQSTKYKAKPKWCWIGYTLKD